MGSPHSLPATRSSRLEGGRNQQTGRLAFSRVLFRTDQHKEDGSTTFAGGLVVGAAVSFLKTVLGAVAGVLFVPLFATAVRGALEAALCEENILD